MDEEKDLLLPRCVACGGTRGSNLVGQRLLLALAALAAAAGGAHAELKPSNGGGQYRSLVWATAGEHAAVKGAGCTGVLLDADWVLLAARCVPDDSTTLTVLAPRAEEIENVTEIAAEGSAAVAGVGDSRQWSQQRRSVQVVRSPNQDTEKGAAAYPALALVRTDRPFELNKSLQPARLFWGPLEDDRRPLRCSVAGWDVVGDENKADSEYPPGLTWAPIGRVLTYAQCAAQEGLVERASQFCVEVAVAAPDVQAVVEAAGAHVNASAEAARRLQRRGLLGNPLLCAGALAGVRFLRSGSRPEQTQRYRIDVFVNATDLEPWIRQHVKDLKVVTHDNGIVLPGIAYHTTQAPVRRSHGGHIGRTSGQPGQYDTSVLFVACAAIFMTFTASGLSL